VPSAKAVGFSRRSFTKNLLSQASMFLGSRIGSCRYIPEARDVPSSIFHKDHVNWLTQQFDSERVSVAVLLSSVQVSVLEFSHAPPF
jgi:hypothetical protein